MSTFDLDQAIQDATASGVEIRAVTARFAETLVDPVTGKLDVGTLHVAFGQTFRESLQIITSQVFQEGGTPEDAEKVCRAFGEAVEAGFTGGLQ